MYLVTRNSFLIFLHILCKCLHHFDNSTDSNHYLCIHLSQQRWTHHQTVLSMLKAYASISGITLKLKKLFISCIHLDVEHPRLYRPLALYCFAAILRPQQTWRSIISYTLLICFISMNYLLCFNIKFHPNDIYLLRPLIQVISNNTATCGFIFRHI